MELNPTIICPHCKEPHTQLTHYCPSTGELIPSNNQSKEAFVDELKKLLDQHKWPQGELKNLYLDTQCIPEKIKQNALESCSLHDLDDEIVGILDLTAFGTGKDYLIFGTKALFFHNPKYNKCAGSSHLSYKYLCDLKLKRRKYIKISFTKRLHLDISIYLLKPQMAESLEKLINSVLPLME